MSEHSAEGVCLLEMARHDLLLRMRNESEDRYAAGWLIDLEYMLWSEPEWEALGRLVGGWWVWPERFVPLEEWETMYAKHSDGLAGVGGEPDHESVDPSAPTQSDGNEGGS